MWDGVGTTHILRFGIKDVGWGGATHILRFGPKHGISDVGWGGDYPHLEVWD